MGDVTGGGSRPDRRRTRPSDETSVAPTGLIVGRFNPPHLGHSFMIDWAAARCERLVVFVNTRAGEAVPGSLRASWLAQLHPQVTVVEVAHSLDNDFADEGLWARWIALFRERWPHAEGPHVVFSSDAYVAELARRLGAQAVVVDADRATVPVSATMVREDPAANLQHLAPVVRDWVVRTWVATERPARVPRPLDDEATARRPLPPPLPGTQR